MEELGDITFNMKSNTVKINNNLLTGVEIKSKEKVRLMGKIELPPRAECIIPGRCNSKISLLEGDFVPQKINGISGVYISKAKVQPDIDGKFQLLALKRKFGSNRINE